MKSSAARGAEVANNASARAVAEWRGKTPDTKVPPHVRLRIFDRCRGICHLSGRKIMAGDKWELDHIKALVNGGENRELNLAPALVAAHREKTKADVALKSKVYRVRAKYLGTWPPPARKLQGRPFPKRADR